ncbi:hypothetical protein EPN52_02860 [bacterium]|nr:MAG: hypothetical protein EPN52_02860 [bacterium]
MTMQRTMLGALASLLLIAATAAAPSGGGTTVGQGDVTFRTPGTFILNNKTGDFRVPQDFTLERPGSDARADRATGNFRRKVAVLTGNVVMHQTQPINDKGEGIKQATQKPMTITCTELTVDWAAKTYTAVGQVHVVQDGDTVDADRAVLDDRTHELTLQGNVRMHQGPSRTADAPQVNYNTQDKGYRASGGVITLFPVPTPSPGPSATPKPARHGRR